MSILPESTFRRNPEVGEFPRTPKPVPPHGLTSYRTDPAREVTFPGEFLDLEPTKVEIQVFRALIRLVHKHRCAGIFPWASNLANELGCSVRAVELALARLVEAGLVVVDRREIVVEGRLQYRTVYWCRWLYEDFRQGTFDFGHGVQARLDPAAPTVFSCTTRAQISPKEIAPKEGYTNKTTKETTTQGDVSSSFVQYIPEGAGGDTPPASTEPSQSPAIDPQITAAIDRWLPGEPDPTKIRAAVPEWLALGVTVAWVCLVIEEMAGYKADGRRIYTFKRLGLQILKNWIETGEPTPRFAAKPVIAPASNQPTPDEAERGRAERARAAAEHAAKLGAWERLTPPERSALEAEYDRDHPQPAGVTATIWRMTRSAALRELAAERSGRV
jgi:hypothetical protein